MIILQQTLKDQLQNESAKRLAPQVHFLNLNGLRAGPKENF